MECPSCGEEMCFEPSTLLWMCPNCGESGYEEDIEEWTDEELHYRNVYPWERDEND